MQNNGRNEKTSPDDKVSGIHGKLVSSALMSWLQEFLGFRFNLGFMHFSLLLLNLQTFQSKTAQTDIWGCKQLGVKPVFR